MKHKIKVNNRSRSDDIPFSEAFHLTTQEDLWDWIVVSVDNKEVVEAIKRFIKLREQQECQRILGEIKEYINGKCYGGMCEDLLEDIKIIITKNI